MTYSTMGTIIAIGKRKQKKSGKYIQKIHFQDIDGDIFYPIILGKTVFILDKIKMDESIQIDFHIKCKKYKNLIIIDSLIDKKTILK